MGKYRIEFDHEGMFDFEWLLLEITEDGEEIVAVITDEQDAVRICELLNRHGMLHRAGANEEESE